MAITWLIEDSYPLGKDKVIRALLRENGTIKRADVIVAHNANPTMQDVQAAWDAAPVLANGDKRWDELELDDAQDLGRAIAIAMAKVVKANGPAAQMLGLMVAAAEAELIGVPKYNQAYQRLEAAWQAGTAPQQRKFLMIIALLMMNKIGQR